LTNSRKGSRRPSRSATRAIVVDSPPGMMRAWQRDKSCCVRTSMGRKGGEVNCRRALRWLMCSRKAPCRAAGLVGSGWNDYLGLLL
jgi:hypothetical protein